MRLLELIRSRAFRLALIYAAFFGVSITILLAVIYALAATYVESHVDEFVQSELEMYEADFKVDGPLGVLGLVESRENSDHSDRWLYLYVDPQGRHLAGDHAPWPDAEAGADGFITLPRSDHHRGEVRARSAVFADGSRILVGLDDYEVNEMRSALERAMATGLVAMLLLAIGGGVLVSIATQRQLEPINRVTREIMVGDLRRRVPVGRNDDEFDALGTNINAMLDRIGVLMDAVRGVTDNIAHDLRMPLARLRGRLEQALMGERDVEALRQLIEGAIVEVDSILATFGALLRIANVESVTLKPTFAEVDLAAIVRDAEQVFEPMASATGRRLRARAFSEVRCLGNRDLLFQALANLIDNAIKYTDEGAQIDLTLAADELRAVVTIADDGPGIARDQRERVFQRLYRVDASRSGPGSGLGLALVRAVADLHGGSSRIEDNEPGTRVVLTLPRLPDRSYDTGSSAKH